MIGESLVLVGTEPGYLCFDQLVPGSVVARSTYESGGEDTVVYAEGKDFEVDYEKGTIARTAESRMPDFRTNVLYGKKPFDHNDFPGFGNGGFFVFVDYETRGGFPLFEKTDQSSRLRQTAEKLEAGGPFRMVAYGDSITAGGDATQLHLRFQRRYANWLGDRFPSARIEVENGATGGDSTVQGLARLEEKVLTRNPDLVLLGFGMNDHNINGVAPAQFEENLVTLVTRIREATGAEVLMYSTFPPNDDWAHGSHRMEQYAAATRRASERTACAYADVYGAWMKLLQRKDPSSLLGNNINHPNDFGHWLYFQTLKSVRF
jgi:lysophospholipase L1-like esterase